MSTLFTDIYDLSMITIVDYKIDKLAETNIEAFKTYFEGFLVKAIPTFHGCLQGLETEEILTEKQFVNTLTPLEQSILADLTVIQWFTSKIQDVTQFQKKLPTRDFKIVAEDSNLKAKSAYILTLREKVRQQVADYQLENFDTIFGLV